ncbi:hypothetical protein Chor_015453, partial [Crotalus horridus]
VPQFCLRGFSQEKQRQEDFTLVLRAEREKTAIFSSGRMKRYKEFIALPPPKRKFCQECQQLLLPSEWERHSGHPVLTGISAAQLGRPSQLLAALENKKMNAQYLFTDRSCRFLLDFLVAQGFQRVLCVGTPRLHELIKLEAPPKGKIAMKSLLLDIDFRYSQFYSQEDFCHYNMFNHYFFAGEVLPAKSYLSFGYFRIFLSPAFLNFFQVSPCWIIRFCPICQRYVSAQNQHCDICSSCPSKDGRRWTHCNLCKKCVKPSWVHCGTCQRCALPTHLCKEDRSGCFVCGEANHKRTTCPKRQKICRADQ